ncbi:MAG: hypothetical protein NT141_00370 [candidate division WWE3 bacterium]|nr:hypothetical protein [candidate division WWE3 bacterium]
MDAKEREQLLQLKLDRRTSVRGMHWANFLPQQGSYLIGYGWIPLTEVNLDGKPVGDDFEFAFEGELRYFIINTDFARGFVAISLTASDRGEALAESITLAKHLFCYRSELVLLRQASTGR